MSCHSHWTAHLEAGMRSGLFITTGPEGDGGEDMEEEEKEEEDGVGEAATTWEAIEAYTGSTRFAL